MMKRFFVLSANTDEDYDHLEIYCSNDNFVDNKQGEELVELLRIQIIIFIKLIRKIVHIIILFIKLIRRGYILNLGLQK